MSEYFTGITFPQQKVTPSDDASIRRAMLADGILSGCELSYSGSTLTMTAGLMIACGRQFRHTAAQNWAVVDANSGFARLLLTIDTTRTSSKEAFDQITDSIEYASSIDGFPELQQADINASGTIYQVVVCVVSLGTGGITGIVSQIKDISSTHFEATLSLPAASWVGDAAPYTQTVAVDGILSTDNPHYGVVYAADQETRLAQKEAFALVDDLETADGVVTFTCFEDKPGVDLDIQMEVNR